MPTSPPPSESLRRLLADRSATVGVIGLGYVGLPLAAAIARTGFRTVGFDIDPGKIADIGTGTSYIGAVSDEHLGELVRRGALCATQEFEQLAACDVVVICVPTPLTRYREPDLSYVRDTAQMVARYLRRGQLVVLESTTYPGTTSEVLKPILEGGGLRSGTDFFLGFSPEREDPGNARFETFVVTWSRTTRATGARLDFGASIVLAGEADYRWRVLAINTDTGQSSLPSSPSASCHVGRYPHLRLFLPSLKR